MIRSTVLPYGIESFCHKPSISVRGDIRVRYLLRPIIVELSRHTDGNLPSSCLRGQR